MKKVIFMLIILLLAMMNCNKAEEDPKFIEETITYTYNENGDIALVEKEEKYPDSDEIEKSATAFLYEYNFYTNKILRKYEVALPENYEIKDGKISNNVGTLANTLDYQYDANGNLSQEAFTGSYLYLYEYDSENLLIKRTLTKRDENRTLEIETYQYDENKHLKKKNIERMFTSSQEHITYIYENDEKGNKVKEIEIYNIIIEKDNVNHSYTNESLYTNTYDDKGNIVKIEKEPKEKQKGYYYIETYEYDKNNKLIKKVIKDSKF